MITTRVPLVLQQNDVHVINSYVLPVTSVFEENIDYLGFDLPNANGKYVHDVETCAILCQHNPLCYFFTYVQRMTMWHPSKHMLNTYARNQI